MSTSYIKVWMITVILPWLNFKQLYTEVKCKPGQRDYLPWLTEKIRSLMKQRDHAIKIALKSKVRGVYLPH